MRPAQILATLLLACAAGPAHAAPGARADPRPNVILIMADDLGFETLGSYGGESYRSPHLDQMAGKGMRFEHCYSTPLCTPSRVQIMTRYVHDTAWKLHEDGRIYNIQSDPLERKPLTEADLPPEARERIRSFRAVLESKKGS